MLKLSALIGALAFFSGSWLSGLTIPRFTQGPADYLLMPLLGYCAIIISAQIAARLTSRTDQA